MIGTDNQTITATSNDSQTWKAAYQIKSGDSGFLKWSLSGIDRAGNNLVLGTSEPVEGLEFIAYNQKKYVADTVQPLVQTMTFETDRPSNVFKYGTNDRLILLEGDKLTLKFTSNKQLLTPTINLKIGSDNRSLNVTNIDSPNGKSWQADYTIASQDMGEIQWKIIAIDPIGNPVQIDNNTVQFNPLSIGAKDIVFNQFGAYIYEADTLLPDLISFKWSSDNQGISDDDRSNTVLVKQGDNLTFSFVTNKRIVSPTETGSFVNMKPELKYFDNSNQEILTASVRPQTYDNGSPSNSEGSHWEAIFSVPDNLSFESLSTDLGFKLKFSDYHTQQTTVGFNHDLSAVNSNSVLPSEYNKARIDTRAPTISSVKLFSSNTGRETLSQISSLPSKMII